MKFAMWFCFAAMVALGLMVPLAHNAGERIGHEKGRAQARDECQQATIDELTLLISSSQYLVTRAHEASQQLSQSISVRQQADAQTTRELRHALALTAAERAQCRFDADSLRHIEAARDRAADAVTSGIGGAMPAASGND